MSEQHAFEFHGGPWDGRRQALPDTPMEYFVAVKIQVSLTRPLPNKPSVPGRRAVYLRERDPEYPHFGIYRFSHFEWKCDGPWEREAT